MKYSFKFPISLSVVDKRVDAENGIIYGVSLCTAGPALGHKVLIDGTTLDQLVNLAKKFKDGLPIKFRIDDMDHNEGKGTYCGLMPADSIRKEGGKVVGDVHLMKAFPFRSYLIELAETQPTNFGLSIEADGKPVEKDGMLLARFESLSSAAFVDMPAANHNGLFSVKPESTDPKPKSTENKTTDMDEAQLTELIKTGLSEGLKPMSEKFTALESRLAKLETPEKKPAAEAAPSEDEIEGMSEGDKTAAGIEEGDELPEKQKKVAAYKKLLSQPATVGTMMSLFRKAGATGIASTSKPNKGGEGKGAIQLYRAEVMALVEQGVGEGAAVQAVTKKNPELCQKFHLAREAAIKAGTYKPITFGK